MEKFQELERKEIFKNRHITIFNKKLRLPNNKIVDWTFFDKRDAVGMLGVFEDDTILMVRQYRPAIGKITLELPAGLLEDGEDPMDGAKREFEEETGYCAEKVEKICEYMTSPGMSEGKFYLYYGENLKKTKQCLDNDEFIEVVRIPLKDIKIQELCDAKTIIGIQYLKKMKGID